MFRPLVFAGVLLLSGSAAFAESESATAARLQTLSALVRDPHPRVRMEALRALSTIHSAKAAEIALGVLDQPMDPTLDYALWLTINDLSEPWIAALESGAWKTDGREKQLAFALKAIKPEQASRVIGRVLSDKPLPRDGSGPWIELIGQAGGAKELGQVYKQTLDNGFDDKATVRALTALADASRLRKMRPEGDTKALTGLLNSSSQEVRAATIRLAGAWKSHSPAELRLAEFAGAGSGDVLRDAAFEVLRQTGGAESAAILKQLSESTDAVTQRRAVTTWAAGDLPAASPSIVKTVTGLTDETAAQEFWRALLAIKGSGKAVAELLPASGIPAAAARTGMRVAREGGRNDVELVMALAKGAGLATDLQAFNGQLIRDLAAKAAASGDPRRGEMVYRRQELACTTCHAIGGAGGRVGPDMTSIGASAQPDYLVEAVLMPNAKIKEGYHGVVVETKDGQTISGTVVRESASELVLRSPANKEVVLAKSAIESRNNSTASLMPSGLLENLSEGEQLDLFAFLSQLGKPGDFDASRGGVARKWRLANVVHTDLQNGQADWMWKTGTDDKRWSEVLSLVNGDLTRSLMEGTTKGQFWVSKVAVLALTEVSVANPVKADFKLTANPATELWIDGTKVTGPVQLSAGTHRVIVRIDPIKVPERIRLETADAAFVLN
jgi:putative heme-binding domain-containing protein